MEGGVSTCRSGRAAGKLLALASSLCVGWWEAWCPCEEERKMRRLITMQTINARTKT